MDFVRLVQEKLLLEKSNFEIISFIYASVDKKKTLIHKQTFVNIGNIRSLAIKIQDINVNECHWNIFLYDKNKRESHYMSTVEKHLPYKPLVAIYEQFKNNVTTPLVFSNTQGLITFYGKTYSDQSRFAVDFSKSINLSKYYEWSQKEKERFSEQFYKSPANTDERYGFSTLLDKITNINNNEYPLFALSHDNRLRAIYDLTNLKEKCDFYMFN